MADEKQPAVGSAHPMGGTIGGAELRPQTAVDWEWIYGEMVDPGLEPHPGVTSVFNDGGPDVTVSDSGGA